MDLLWTAPENPSVSHFTSGFSEADMCEVTKALRLTRVITAPHKPARRS